MKTDRVIQLLSMANKKSSDAEKFYPMKETKVKVVVFNKMGEYTLFSYDSISLGKRRIERVVEKNKFKNLVIITSIKDLKQYLFDNKEASS